ncbi:MAG: DSD1 family PLP-dependent enzyme [bacterium]|nr:DSD1 family PLP-dependent enzyme [bacterium]
MLRVAAPEYPIDTPALIVDAGILLANIRRMAGFFAGRPAKLRPHFKTHKTPAIAHLQLQHGAIGITCAKLGEAEVLVHAGIRDVLIANQVTAPAKVARLAGLAHIAHLKVCVDDEENLLALSRAAVAAGSRIGVLVEVDVGMGRSGTRSAPATLRLAARAASLPGIDFQGVMGYEGHAVFRASREDREAACRAANACLLDHAAAVRQEDIPCPLVSAGGTGTYDISGDCPGITEVEAGSYVFMDATYRKIVPEFATALTALATVISRPEPSRAVIDLGMKAVTGEFGLPQPEGLPGATTLALSEEHGVLELEGPARDLRVGDQVVLLPTHCCTTVNLHDRLHVSRGGRVQDVWTIAARGAFC